MKKRTVEMCVCMGLMLLPKHLAVPMILIFGFGVWLGGLKWE